MFVRELRQAIRRENFGLDFLILSLALTLVTALMIQGIKLGDTRNRLHFFHLFYLILSVRVQFFLPIKLYENMRSEILENSYELVAITTLTPAQIVWGKLASGLIPLLLMHIFLLPFLLVSLFQSDGSFWIFLVLLVHSILYGNALLLLGMMLGSLSRQLHWQVISSIVLLTVCLLVFAITVAFINIDGNPLDFDPILLINIFFGWALFLIIEGVVCFHVTEEQLSPIPYFYILQKREHDNENC